jgi:hypothetical protein
MTQHIPGSIIAVAYATIIVSILWWMLHVPRAGDVEQQVRRVTREASRFSRIVVPVQGDVVSDRIVALASQMAKFRGATMDVLYVIEVLTLPISAAMGIRSVWRRTLTRASKVANRYDVKISKG